MKPAIKHTAGPWQIRRCRLFVLYTVSRRSPSGQREHLEIDKNGRPALYTLEQAQAAIAKATGSAA